MTAYDHVESSLGLALQYMKEIRSTSTAFNFAICYIGIAGVWGLIEIANAIREVKEE